MLYQLLALPHVQEVRLALPYLARSQDEYLASLADPNQHARALPQQVSQPLADIVEGRCLCDDKTRRYRVASELSHDLRAWLRRTGTRRRAGAVLAIVLPLLVISLSAAAYLASSRREALPESAIEREGPDGPAFRPRQLDSGTWNKLLDRPLRKLKWPGAGELRVLQPDYDLEELTISLQGIGILEAGQIAQPNYMLKLRARQPGWNGKFGLFYGLQPRGQGYVCELIKLEHWVDAERRPIFRLDRGEILLSADFYPTNTDTRSSQRVSVSGDEQELTIAVRNGAVHSVTWGGEDLPGLLQDARLDLPPLDCRGGFGLYVERTSLTALQFRIFPEDLAPNDERP